MPANTWWNVFYDEWIRCLSTHPEVEDSVHPHSNTQCVDECVHIAKIALILRLYAVWTNRKQSEHNKTIQYFSNKIKERSHKKGVQLYYLHRAFAHTVMHEYEEGIKDLYHGCILHNSNQDTVWALCSILYGCTNEKQKALECLLRGEERCPGSSVIKLLLDKMRKNNKLCVSDIECLNIISDTDDDDNDNDNNNKDNVLMNNVKTMMTNRDGIPIIYFVLRLLYKIIESPANNKRRQLNIAQIKQHTHPYGDAAINMLLQCGFEWISHNKREFLLLRPCDDAKEVKSIAYLGEEMNKALLNMPILHLMEGLKEFKIEDMMRHYHHICLHHTTTAHNTLETLRYFETHNAHAICKASDCCVLRRMYRNLGEDASGFMRKRNYGTTESRHIVLMQILDEMHTFLYHSVSLYQYQDFAQKALKQSMQKLSMVCCFKKTEYKDDDGDDDDDDDETSHLKISEYEQYKADANKYTQVIESYAQTIPKHHDMFLNSKFIDKLGAFNDDTCVVVPVDDIVAKYCNLKQEMLFTAHISVFEWNDVEYRCCNLYKSWYCRALGVDYDDLIALFLWSQYHALHDLNIADITHCAKLLRECVSVHGEEMERDMVYHCFDDHVLFNECQMGILLPFSCTSNFAFAEISLRQASRSSDGNGNGIVVAFSNYHHDWRRSKYFNLQWISPFCGESEVITYDAQLIIVNIMHVMSMEQYTISNLLFFYIWNGNNIVDLHLMQFQNEVNQCLLNMIETFLKKNINYRETTSYQQLLFNQMITYFMKTKKAIFVDEIQGKYVDQTLIQYILHLRNSDIALYKFIQKMYKLRLFTDSIFVPIYLNHKVIKVTFIVKIRNEQSNVMWFIKVNEFPTNVVSSADFRWKLDIPSLNINIDSTLAVDSNCKLAPTHFVLCSKEKFNQNKTDTVSVTLSIVCRSYTLVSNHHSQINQDPTL